MNSLALFLIGGIIIHAMICLWHHLVLKPTTLHKESRYFLLFGMLMPLLAPLVLGTLSNTTDVFFSTSISLPEINIEAASTKSAGVNLPSAIFLLYCIGVLIRSFLLIRSISGIIRLKAKGTIKKFPTYSLITLKEDVPVFTFLNLLFWNVI